MFECSVLVLALIFVCVGHRRDDWVTLLAKRLLEARWAAEPDGTQSGLSFTSRPPSVPHWSIKPTTKPDLPPEISPKLSGRMAWITAPSRSLGEVLQDDCKADLARLGRSIKASGPRSRRTLVLGDLIFCGSEARKSV